MRTHRLYAAVFLGLAVKMTARRDVQPLDPSRTLNDPAAGGIVRVGGHRSESGWKRRVRIVDRMNIGGGESFHEGDDSTRGDEIRSGPVNDRVFDGTIIGRVTIDGRPDTIEAAAARVAAWHP